MQEIQFKMNNQAEQAELTSISELGALVSLHPRAHASSGFRWIMVYIMAGITGLILLFGLYSFLRTFQSGYLTGSLIGAALPAILMVVGIFDAQKFQDVSLAIFEQGIAFRDKKGVTKWRWDEINKVQSSLVNLIRNGVSQYLRAYQVHHRDGRTLDFGNAVSNSDEAIALIKKQVYPRLAPAMYADLDAGKTVSFGALSADAQGLQFGKRSIPYSSLSKLMVRNGSLVFTVNQPKPQEHQVLLAQLHNADLLFALLSQAAPSAASAA